MFSLEKRVHTQNKSFSFENDLYPVNILVEGSIKYPSFRCFKVTKLDTSQLIV